LLHSHACHADCSWSMYIHVCSLFLPHCIKLPRQCTPSSIIGATNDHALAFYSKKYFVSEIENQKPPDWNGRCKLQNSRGVFLATSLHVSSPMDIRIQDYLDDKIQTVADLEVLDVLLENVKNQQDLLKKQVRTCHCIAQRVPLTSL
jgi:hypothetical protein